MLRISDMYFLLPEIYQNKDRFLAVMQHHNLLRSHVFHDYSDCDLAPVAVEGMTPKTVISYHGKNLMLKFTKGNAKDFITEYLGSAVAKSLGYPAQNVDLGYYNGRECCAVEMFELPIITVAGLGTSTKNGYSEYDLDTLLEFPYEPSKFAYTMDWYKKYVWSVFVLDLFLGNYDRHENNWGFHTIRGKYVPTPLFDFGSCLEPRFLYSVPELSDSELLHKLRFGMRCAILQNGKKKNYFEILESNSGNIDLVHAVRRLLHEVNTTELWDILYSICVYDKDLECYADYTKRVLLKRIELLSKFEKECGL